MKSQFKLSLVLTFILSACSTVPTFDSSKNIEAKEGAFIYSFSQEGQSVNDYELIKKLKEVPETKPKAESAEYLMIGSWVGAGVGGFFLGQALGITIHNNPGDSATNALLIGLSASSVGLLLWHLSSDQLNDAVEIHNTLIDQKNIPPIKAGQHSSRGFYFYPVVNLDRKNNSNGYYLGSELAYRF